MTRWSQLPFERRLALGLAGLFLLAFGLYLRALSPAFHPDDSPETITAGATLSIQHPPGYPLHSLLGRLATVLGPGPATFNINALSAFAAAIGVVLAALLLLRLGREFAPWAASQAGLAAFALAGALLLGVSRQYFFQASIAKGGLYTLNLALSFGILLALLSAREALLLRPRGAPLPAGLWRHLGLAALLFGLGMANHWTSQVLLLPCAAVLVGEGLWLRRPALGRRDALSGLSLPGLALLGLLLYLFLPIRSRLGAPLIWGQADSFKDLLWVFSRSQYAGVEAGKSLAQFLVLLRYIAERVIQDWTWVGLPLLAGGWALLLRKRPWLSLGLLGLPAGLAVAVAWKANPPSDSYFIMDPYLLPLHLGLGLGLAGWVAQPRLRGYLAPAALALALGLGAWHWRDVEHRHDYLGWDYVNNLLLSVPQDALLVCEGDSNTAGPYVPRFVQGRRQDLTLVATVLADYPWYQALLTRHDPRIQVPGSAQGSPGAVLAWLAAKNPERPMVWTNTYSAAWTDEGRLLHRGLVLRRQEQRKPFKPELLARENVWPAYSLRGAFEPGARRMDALTVRLVRDNYVEALARLAQAYLDAQAHAAARREFRLLGMLRPGWAPPWLQAGNAAWFAGDRAGAQADWERASREDPRSAEAWANLGLLAFHAGRNDEAASLARKALALNPELANAKELQQQALQAAVSPPPKPTAGGEAQALRGDQLAQAQRWAEALAAYDAALKQGYVNAALHRNRGVMLGQLGRPADAAEALAQARRLAPDNAEAVKLHGFFLFNSGRQAEGLAALEEAVRLAPQDAETKRLRDEARKVLKP
jgi:tetratricopeptide (TPR) repeat protein